MEGKNLEKGFDGRTLIKDLSFTLPRNGIVGVIGPNGVGKTTLFKTIVGLEQPDAGTEEVGDTVHLSEVVLPEGVELVARLDDEHNPAVAVARHARVEAEPEAAEDEAGADVPAAKQDADEEK